MPAGQRQSGVGDYMGRPVNILSLARRRIVLFKEVISEEGVDHLRHSGVEVQEARQPHGGFHFEAVSAARPFEFKTAVIWDVDLFVRAVDQEQIGAHAEPIEVLRDPYLVEVSSRYSRPVGSLHDAARVLTGDASTIVEIEGHRHALTRRQRQVEFRLRAQRPLRTRSRWINSVINLEVEIIVAKPAFEMQMAAEQVEPLLDVTRHI